MPVPKPRKGEKQDAFVSRCVRRLSKLDPNRKHDQIVAMCFSQFRRGKKK